MSNKLIARDLCYSIDGKLLIDQISLEFSVGSLYGILGPNGSGKSTFLKTMAGIWKPTCGDVFWNGETLLAKERQLISRTISLVPQNPQIHFDFLVEDVVAMGRYSHDTRYWDKTNDDLIQNALTIVDAWHLRGRRANCLSHGERQRVYIARALITESPILLLDEPTASLDIRHQIEIWQLLLRLVKEGKIIIVSSHDLSIAERYCHQVAVLNHGRCIGDGHFTNVMTQKLMKEVFGVVETTTPLQKCYML